MKIAVSTIAYNEERFIQPCIKQWKPFGFHHQVLISNKPWNGKGAKKDNTEKIARNLGVEVITGDWSSEHEQRNEALRRLKDYDWVIIADVDEFYTTEAINHLRSYMKEYLTDKLNRTNQQIHCLTGNLITYWKSLDYVFSPDTHHKPPIVVNPKTVEFWIKRAVKDLGKPDGVCESIRNLDINCHHLSWVKSDKEVLNKIKSYSHSSEIKKNWYKDKWLNWTIDTEDLMPYGNEKVKVVQTKAPKDLTEKLNRYIINNIKPYQLTGGC